jgi:hypothetical protein
MQMMGDTGRWLCAGVVGAAMAMAASGVHADGQAQAKPITTLQVSLKIGAASYTASGPGECIHSTEGGLYDTPGTQWGARRTDGNQTINFTMWRLSGKGDSVTLFVTAGGKTHKVNTVPVGPTSNRTGAGTATFEARGAGGVFTLDLRADTGAAITGQMTCSGFSRPEDNGE